MEILDRKKLEVLFSWAQFYHNSEKTDLSQGLEVSRYPRHYYYENGKKRAYVPHTNGMMYSNVQKEIEKVGNIRGENKGSGIILNGEFQYYKDLIK